jgi:predicted amidohydrolase
MSKTVQIAAVQMNADPAPCAERLARAESLILQAARQGAQLVVLPEVFNTGYEYTDKNYHLAEPLDGPTATWMRKLAAHTGAHLAGAFLRLDQGDIYDTLLLVAPDGREWLYDKTYPWMWERAYFRPGRKGTVVADTELGKIGLLICWDSAHPTLWQRYASQVQLMVVSSCPPMINEGTVVAPDGRRIAMSEFGPIQRRVYQNVREIFGSLLRRQSACLNVPVVNTSGIGNFSTTLPSPRISFWGLSQSAPQFWKYLPHAAQIRIESGYFYETYVADATGSVLQQVPPNVEGYVVAEAALPDSPPAPQGSQPAFGISWLNYFFDAFANWVLARVYQQKRTSPSISSPK